MTNVLDNLDVNIFKMDGKKSLTTNNKNMTTMQRTSTSIVLLILAIEASVVDKIFLKN